jgi:hypothetical protein
MKKPSEAVELIEKYAGKKWMIAPRAAEIFAHEEYDLPIRFMSPEKLMENLVENYGDRLAAGRVKCVNRRGRWVNPDVTPIAAVGYSAARGAADDAEFLDESFAFLFYDARGKKILYATRREWGLDKAIEDIAVLGLHEG